jgi:hypothetical protein
MGEDAIMPQSNEALQRKRRRKAVPVLGAAGLSLAVASGASAAVGDMSVNLPARTARVSQQMTLRDEEIADVSLATFHVFDKESTQRPSARLAQSGGCGCGCGSSFYYRAAPAADILSHRSLRLNELMRCLSSAISFVREPCR